MACDLTRLFSARLQPISSKAKKTALSSLSMPSPRTVGKGPKKQGSSPIPVAEEIRDHPPEHRPSGGGVGAHDSNPEAYMACCLVASRGQQRLARCGEQVPSLPKALTVSFFCLLMGSG